MVSYNKNREALSRDKPEKPKVRDLEKNHVCLGRFDRPYAVHGWISFTPYCDDPASIAEFSDLLILSATKARPKNKPEINKSTVVAQKVSTSGKRWIAKIEGYNSPESVSELTGYFFGVESSKIQKPADDEWLLRDLIGLKIVLHAKRREIGFVRAIKNYGAGELLEICNKGGKNIFDIPFAKEYVLEVSIANNEITVVDDIEILKM